MHIVRKKSAEERKPLENVSVLILGEVNDAQDVVRIILEQSGAMVHIARNAIQAAGLLMNVHPDLFISSVHETWTLQVVQDNPSIASIGLVTHPHAEFEKALSLGFLAASSVAEPRHMLATAERLAREPVLAQ